MKLRSENLSKLKFKISMGSNHVYTSINFLVHVFDSQLLGVVTNVIQEKSYFGYFYDVTEISDKEIFQSFFPETGNFLLN